MRVTPPQRARHSYLQRLHAPPREAFPLLCPVREAEWISGWDPLLVLTNSGRAEGGCVFIMAGEPAAIWTVTRFEPPERIDFVKVTPGVTVGQISIILRPDADGGTFADVTYGYTSLGTPEGDAAVRAFTLDAYTAAMALWERRLNHFLATGERLAE
jgi:hypothetical protein